jgi:hypothetical protein
LKIISYFKENQLVRDAFYITKQSIIDISLDGFSKKAIELITNTKWLYSENSTGNYRPVGILHNQIVVLDFDDLKITKICSNLVNLPFWLHDERYFGVDTNIQNHAIIRNYIKFCETIEEIVDRSDTNPATIHDDYSSEDSVNTNQSIRFTPDFL